MKLWHLLAGKCSGEEMLAQIEMHPPVLRERARAFYMAVKRVIK